MDGTRDDRHWVPESVLSKIRHVSQCLAAARAGDVSEDFESRQNAVGERLHQQCRQRTGHLPLKMGWLYRDWVRPMLFAQDAERAHNSALKMLRLVSHSRSTANAAEDSTGDPELPVRVFGLKFPNPVGLAAGMDKHAV